MYIKSVSLTEVMKTITKTMYALLNIFDNYFQAGILATNMADGAQLINGFEWYAL